MVRVTEKTAFSDLGLDPRLEQRVSEMGYEEPTPIQARAIPEILAGKDVLGCAQTGTGKTAAFVLPTLQRMSTKKGTKALVVTPTRELADQIQEVATECAKATGHSVASLVGGVSYGPQRAALKSGVDLIIATPGRLLDMMGQGATDFSHLETLILDEADRMLDMGFWPDVKRVIRALPKKRQTLLFSATLPPEVIYVIGTAMIDPVSVEVGRRATPVDQIEQRVYPVDAMQKDDLLAALLKQLDIEKALIFVETKRKADFLHRFLRRHDLPAAVIHSDFGQGQRRQALSGFKSGKYRFLLATDIVARGIDIEGISHVINFDIPPSPEDYVHRIGRTARAGETGVAISLLAAEELAHIRDIEALIRRKIPVEDLPGFDYSDRFVPSGKSKINARPVKRLAFNGGARRHMQKRRRRR